MNLKKLEDNQKFTTFRTCMVGALTSSVFCSYFVFLLHSLLIKKSNLNIQTRSLFFRFPAEYDWSELNMYCFFVFLLTFLMYVFYVYFWLNEKYKEFLEPSLSKKLIVIQLRFLPMMSAISASLAFLNILALSPKSEKYDFAYGETYPVVSKVISELKINAKPKTDKEIQETEDGVAKAYKEDAIKIDIHDDFFAEKGREAVKKSSIFAGISFVLIIFYLYLFVFTGIIKKRLLETEI